jgi:hypothetical protein
MHEAREVFKMFPKKVKQSLMINDLCIIGDDNNMKNLFLKMGYNLKTVMLSHTIKNCY